MYFYSLYHITWSTESQILSLIWLEDNLNPAERMGTNVIMMEAATLRYYVTMGLIRMGTNAEGPEIISLWSYNKTFWPEPTSRQLIQQWEFQLTLHFYCVKHRIFVKNDMCIKQKVQPTTLLLIVCSLSFLFIVVINNSNYLYFSGFLWDVPLWGQQ